MQPLVQLFLLANNFTFRNSRREAPIELLAKRHDERVISILQPLGSRNVAQFKSLLSANNPSTGAIREQIFASALITGNFPLLQTILETGVELDTVMDMPPFGHYLDSKWSPLAAAVRIEDEETSLKVIRLLIEHGSNVDGDTSLLEAAVEIGHKEIVELLI
ncbi:hypothetical protein B0H63DRAFT_546571 [Podospora didyma]|uniref:Ankyrin n=1 Tax=Podospora didyma TaxID=330526 RepID=A0AAE0TWB8_9PEZI|nr:hypothetical protein B0H63DRAFT_546571 [Podospora didyma]